MPMENVSYKLEAFEGPLDLLLFLINKNKVDIMDIPIAEILRQYLDYMPVIKAQNLDNVTEFTVMASALVYIKSKMLLPKPETEEDDPRQELAQALLEYKKFKEAAAWFTARLPDGQLTMTRGPETLPKTVRTDYRNKPDDLQEALKRILVRDERRRPAKKEAFSKILHQEVVSIEEKSSYILSMLDKLGKLDITALFYGERDRHHAVASFLAVLELVREGSIRIEEGEADHAMIRLCDRIMA